jgi:signal transduction histidine kinase/response regulator of citrate/malate metabolism
VASRDSEPVRVLLVEDNPGDADLILARVEEEEARRPLELQVCATLAAAMEAVEAAPPELILLDLGLPDSAGLETFERMHAAAPGIPLIVLTGHADLEMADRCIALGAQDYLLKGKVEGFIAWAVHNTVARARAQDELHLAEGALRESERILDATGAMARIGGWEHDLATGAAVWTRALYDIIEIPHGEAPPGVDEHLSYYAPADRATLESAYTSAIETGAPFDLELQVRTATGRPIWCRVQGESIFEDGACVRLRGALQDISAHKAAEERLRESEAMLRQSQRMEAVGQLAGGVAHDFNNLLTVITSYAGFAADALREGDPLLADIQEVLDAARRASTLTRQLLAFSRKQVMEPEILDLNEVVSELEKMLERLIGEDVAFSTALAGDLGRVSADPGQIEQVLMNLVVNARDAMPAGGKLTVETANVELDQAYADQQPDTTPGRYVMLAVSDTGEGMRAEVRERVFEPFYTTKDKGQGTGLGLATVYGIVKQSEGNIWVYSEPGQGTTFKIYLPRVEGEKRATPPEVHTMDLRGDETVLIVEDERSVRDLARRMLAQAGYEVLSAANGGEALLECERCAGAVQLVITDVVMPRMSGRELADRLGRICPGLKVLFMSGYTDNAIVHHGVLDEGTHFIAKPFSAQDLLRKVRAVLESGAG